MTRHIMPTQASLFEEAEMAPAAPALDIAALDNYAFLYTGTFKGNFSGVHFMASTEDAMKWCSAMVSKGVIHGTPWAYFFTRVSTFVFKHMGGEPVIDLDGSSDNLSWDSRIAAAGVAKIALWDIPAVLKPFGVQVRNAPSRIISEILFDQRGIAA